MQERIGIFSKLAQKYKCFFLYKNGSNNTVHYCAAVLVKNDKIILIDYKAHVCLRLSNFFEILIATTLQSKRGACMK